MRDQRRHGERKRSYPVNIRLWIASSLPLLAMTELRRLHCLVSSRFPRFWIVACATSAKRCNNQGNVTSTRT